MKKLGWFVMTNEGEEIGIFYSEDEAAEEAQRLVDTGESEGAWIEREKSKC